MHGEDEVKMKKYLLWSLLISLCLNLATGQQREPEARNHKGKFFLVPELWLAFGTTTYVELSPMLGYHLTERISTGFGPHYIYLSQRAIPVNPHSYHTHVYGVKGFARLALITQAEKYLPVNLFSDIFAHVEYEGMSLEKAYYYSPSYPDDGRFIYHGLMVGGGLIQDIGPRNSVSIMVLWNLNESSRSPYSNPVFRIGYNQYF